MLFLGIDPGAGGGLCALRGGTTEASVVDLRAMPETELEIWSWIIRWWRESHAAGGVYAIIEQVGGYVHRSDDPDSKIGGQPGSAMFKFGWSYGGLRMALVAAGLREGETWRAVVPQTWQKGLKISPRSKTEGEKRNQFKGRLKAEAADLFPDVKVTLKTCDALLLAEYCRRHYLEIR